MGLVFLTPLAALVGIAALVPLLLAAAREERDGRLRQAIRVAAPRAGTRFATALAGGAVVACLASAAAQPALRTDARDRARTDAQLYVVLDVTRSMLASAGPHAPTRFARAVALARRIRAAFPEVPTGLASISDWLLPNALPTLDGRVFDAALEGSVGIGRPAPFVRERNATWFAVLAQLGAGGYYTRSARHRVAILLSDGESRRYAPDAVARALGRAGIDLVVVRLWSPTDAVYVRGRPDRGYTPDPTTTTPLRDLAAATAGGRIFGDGERGAIVAKTRELLGRGPTLTTTRHLRTIALAPYVVLASVLPLGFLLVRR